MVLAHSFVGAPLTHFLVKDLKLSPKFKKLIYFIGITGAVLPDFDLVLSFFINDLNHRRLVSHSIVPYLLIFLTIFFISFKVLKYRNEIRLINKVLFLTILSHLIIDALVGQIVIFAPFDMNLYGIPVPGTSNPADFFVNYFNSIYSLYELIVILPFFIYFKNYKNLQSRFLAYFYFFVAISMVFKYSLI